MALGGAIGFALGTVLAKKLPIQLPPITAAAWQIGLGCFPVADRRPLRSRPRISTASPSSAGGCWSIRRVIQFCVAYVSWFAALARLPASVAAIGTMAVPVIGVVASALALHEPLGPDPDRGAGVHARRRRAGDAFLERSNNQALACSASRIIFAIILPGEWSCPAC